MAIYDYSFVGEVTVQAASEQEAKNIFHEEIDSAEEWEFKIYDVRHDANTDLFCLLFSGETSIEADSNEEADYLFKATCPLEYC